MLKQVKISYLENTDYIYDGDTVVAVWHTDTDTMIVQGESPYTEEEIEGLLGGAVIDKTPTDPETKARRVEMIRQRLERLDSLDRYGRPRTEE